MTMTTPSVTPMSVSKHFVTFFSPGTFVPEQSQREIPSWDVDAAVAMAGTIVERYGARPYAFRFETWGRGDDDLDSKRVKHSNLYYLGGKLETLAEVEARDDPKENTLRCNMRANKIDRIIVNDNSWRFTGAFNGDDVLLDVTLPPLAATEQERTP